jgi:hypothetical protein
MKASVLFAPRTPLKAEELEVEHVILSPAPTCGRCHYDELVTCRYGLDEADEAFPARAGDELSRGPIVS